MTTNGTWMYSETECERRWSALLAPRTGSVATELIDELARYLGMTPEAVSRKLEGATARFKEEWQRTVTDPSDERALIRFYDESSAELFDLVQWHAFDRIHFRTIMCVDLAIERGARTVLDYGSGIGSDALAFAASGFQVTLADVSTPLLDFARWRCREHGFDVRTVDLKRKRLPRRAFDAAVCFDVLEHIPRPIPTLWRIHSALHGGALLFLHAPFGDDPDRPMHLIHKDLLAEKPRVAGFERMPELQRRFPAWLWWPPLVYEAIDCRELDRLAYRLYDRWMTGAAGNFIAGLYRQLVPKRQLTAEARPEPAACVDHPVDGR